MNEELMMKYPLPWYGHCHGNHKSFSNQCLPLAETLMPLSIFLRVSGDFVSVKS